MVHIQLAKPLVVGLDALMLSKGHLLILVLVVVILGICELEKRRIEMDEEGEEGREVRKRVRGSEGESILCRVDGRHRVRGNQA